MLFEWDVQKEKSNIEKHGIDFDTAALVFGDDYRIERFDREHSIEEDRFITIGSIEGLLTVMTVVYTERGRISRIISARRASKREAEEYYNGYNG